MRKKNLFFDLIFKLACRYNNWYRAYTYDPRKNGEINLLKLISCFRISTVFDVGANVGDWTKASRDILPTSYCHSFEIFPDTAALLKVRFAFDKFVHVNAFGLGSDVGVFNLRVYEDRSTVNTLICSLDFHSDKSSRIVDVEVFTGDLYCSQKAVTFIDLLKIDVEGSELDVLRGFERFFISASIRIVQFEYGYANGEAGVLMKDFYEFFAKYGYIVGRLERKGVHFADFNYSLNNFESGPNFVAVHMDDRDLIRKLAI